MAADSSELASFVAALEDMSSRVEAMAGRYDDDRNEDIQAILLEAERALQAAIRRLANAQRVLRGR